MSGLDGSDSLLVDISVQKIEKRNKKETDFFVKYLKV